MMWVACAVAFALSCLLTYAIRSYALRRDLIDVPNERSSHSRPVPRGGGVAIVVAFAVVGAATSGAGEPAALQALLVAGSFVALVGFVDDHVQVRAGWRLLMHFAAAAWALLCLRGLPPVPFMGQLVDWGTLGHLLAGVYLVWLLNLYNFMDGIDGIAGVEAISVAGAGALLSWKVAGASQLADWMLVLAASVGGFLVWNFPKARIFMGDAGSGFLGFVLGVFSLLAARQSAVLFWPWVIMLGVFIVDATTTLFRRMARGERLHEAHRTHAYQVLSRRLGSHPKVTLAVLAINLAWLFPWAWTVASGLIDGIVGVVAAYVPLVALALTLRAGESEEQPAGH